MNFRVRTVLRTSPEDHARLLELQKLFSQACNQLAVTARGTRCWNRVALHHLSYKTLREAYPQLGSQMVCNTIYAVSRACRAIYQGRGSPFNIQAMGQRPLPLVQFEPDAPVYFDKHTMSIKNGQVSMFTLDGRIRFGLPLTPEHERRFRQDRIREITMARRQGAFVIDFLFADEALLEPASPPALSAPAALPAFVSVQDQAGLGQPQPIAAADHRHKADS